MNNNHNHSILYLLGIFISCVISSTANAANSDGASDLGVDYAFLLLTTLSPDFAAANYTVENQTGNDIDISIARLPGLVDLKTTAHEKLQLEISAAYQRTKEIIPTLSLENEFIDSEWDSYGLDLGLLYTYKLTDQLNFTPSLRLGVAELDNHATYNGDITNLLKEELDGTIFNWKTSATVLNLGLGLSYEWALRNRQSTVKANIYRVNVNSFDESDPAVIFAAQTNMFSITADMIFPSNHYIANKRLDYVFILGNNTFLGENRRTLGYTTSNQFGIGSELPLSWDNKVLGHIRFSGQVLWAHNMSGWLVTLAYNSN